MKLLTAGWMAVSILALPVVLAFAQSATQQATPAPVACQGDTKQEHGDGIVSKVRLQVSELLHNPRTDRDVRMVSYVIDFCRQPREIVATMSGLIEMEAQSIASKKLKLSGIDPFVGIANALPDAPVHGYEIHLSPVQGKSWGAIAGTTEVVTQVVRVQ